MKKYNLQIEGYNPTYIGFVDNPEHSKIEQKLSNYCLNLKNKVKSGGDNWISNKTFNTINTHDILKDKQFKPLNNWITENVNEYAKTLNYQNKFLCKEGWFNIYNKYDYQEFHTHSNYSLSTIYFLKSPKNGAKTYFNTDPIVDSNRPKLDSKFLPTSTLIYYDPIPGRLLIFRSNILHCVQRHESKEIRISLAYNFSKEE